MQVSAGLAVVTPILQILCPTSAVLEENTHPFASACSHSVCLPVIFLIDVPFAATMVESWDNVHVRFSQLNVTVTYSYNLHAVRH